MSNILKRSIALMVIILLATACTTTPSLQAPTQVPANTNPPGSGDRNAPDGAPWFEVDRSGMGQSIDQVERQLRRPNREGVMFALTETKFGKRSLALGSTSISVLRIHYERQHKERVAAGEKWNEQDLIFTNRTGDPIHPRNLLRDFKILLQKAGLPVIRFHDLRHTAASLMLNQVYQ